MKAQRVAGFTEGLGVVLEFTFLTGLRVPIKKSYVLVFGQKSFMRVVAPGELDHLQDAAETAGFEPPFLGGKTAKVSNSFSHHSDPV